MRAVIDTNGVLAAMMSTRGASHADLSASIGNKLQMRLSLKSLGHQPIPPLQERDDLTEFGIV